MVVLIVWLSPAYASMPTQMIPYPSGNSTGTVSGMVIAGVNGTAGISGAYVAIVNSYNVSQEYANTTSSPSGFYMFTNVGVTGDFNQYKVYAYDNLYGEGYSASFGAIANATIPMSVTIVSINSTPTPTSAPTATQTPTPTPTPSVTPTPTAMPSPTPMVNSTTATPVIPLPTSTTTTPVITTPAPTPNTSPTPAISMSATAITLIVTCAMLLSLKRSKK